MHIACLSFLLLRLEAVRRGKIEYESLYRDMSAMNLLVDNVMLREDHVGTVYEVLGFAG
ncbi:MAG: hypothetical protein ACE5QF_04505 [Thermoplasmata archaeon]